MTEGIYDNRYIQHRSATVSDADEGRPLYSFSNEIRVSVSGGKYDEPLDG